MFTVELCLPHLKVRNSARRPYQIRLSQFYLFFAETYGYSRQFFGTGINEIAGAFARR